MATVSGGSRVWERLGAGTGVVFFLGVLVAVLTGAEPPLVGAAAAEIRNWYGGDQTTYLWTVVVLALGFGALVWFSASIRAMILRVEADGRLASLAFAGGLLTAVMFLAGLAVEAQGFFEASALVQLDDAGLSAVHAATVVVTGGLIGLTTITRGVMLLAVALAGFRFGAQPRWLSWVTGVVAALSWLGILAVAQPGEDSVAGLIWFLAFVAFPIWALIASIELVVRLGRSAG